MLTAATGRTESKLTIAGLHKDPSKFSQLSTVESCVRRQLWWTLVSLDVQIAYSSGLPPMINFEYSDVSPITELSEAIAPDGSQVSASRTDSVSAGKLILRYFSAAKHDFYRRSRDLLHSLHSDHLAEADLDNLIDITRCIQEMLVSQRAQIEAVAISDSDDSIFAESTGLKMGTFAQFAKLVLSMLAAKPFSVMYGPLRAAGLLHVLRARVPK